MATDDDSDVPETGAIFTFGKSKFGDNAPNKFWIRNDKVVHVACGDEHTALVAESGRIFTFGSNDWGQLGLGHNRPSTKPCCIKSLKKEKVHLVACGRSTTFVATESGKLYSFGANGDGQLGVEGHGSSALKPIQIESLEEQKFKQLSAGTEHAVALTESGDVYVWGSGSEGQLGLGPQTEVPTPLQLPLDDRAVCISCGYYHTAIVTEGGKLYTFGETEGGKLGRGEDPEENTTPQEVDGFDGNVVWVSCGGSHTVVITEKGKVYSFGDGNNGQLGHGNVQLQVSEPQVVAYIKEKIKKSACGENHTALISERGQMYTFGDGRHGKLALGEENFANQFRPSLVTRFAKFVVENVDCGGCHMLVLAKPKVENGDWDSGNEDEDEGTDEVDAPRNKNLEILKQSYDLDLSGSFSARDRRREKQDNTNSMGRTLPALNISISGRGLPPLNSTLPARLGPIRRSQPSPLSKIEEPQGEMNGQCKKEKDSDQSEGSAAENDRDVRKKKSDPPVRKSRESLTHTAPVPKPRMPPNKYLKKHDSDEEESDSSESSEEEEDEHKNLTKIEKAKPVPASRSRKPLQKDESEEDSEEDSEDEKAQKQKQGKKLNVKEKKLLMKNKRSKIESEEEEEEEEESEDERQTKKGKVKEKPKQSDKDKKKKGGGYFGRRKQPESEEDEEDEEEEEMLSRKKKEVEKKEKGKIEKPKNKKNKKESEEDEEEEESDEEKREIKAKDKKSKDKSSDKKENKGKEKEDDDDDDADDDSEEDEEKTKKDKKEEPKKEEKKKSKLCVIL